MAGLSGKEDTDSALYRLRAALADRYTIERELGRGGMAIVYLAHDIKHDRQVAVKVLRPELAASIGAERFLREIQITAKLTHPHILPLHDSGEAEGFLYYVMPYVEGESLRDRLDREKQLPIDDALHIAREVADALSAAHSHGVVHRDIKPENILLEAGHAVVADFGIARAVTTAGGTKLTETGIAVGTAMYMSPEQASGGDSLDARSDIYSLACMLYEMLAGDPPFTGSTPQAILARRALEQVPPLRHVRDTVPPGVDQAVTKALAKVPADRYATAQQFVEALVKPGVEKVRPKARRGLGIAAGVVLVMLAVALGMWQWRGGASETTLDPNLVAVMPFRAAGADPSLSYLREGMMEMLAAKLTGEGGPRAADPGTVLAAWRRVASADDAEVTEAQAAGVARTMGAGQYLLGSVVGSPRRLVLSATLSSAGGTSPGATQATVEGPEDSLLAMYDRLTGQLLAGSAGVRGEFGGSLTTSSLDALKAYLDGQVAFRGGQHDEAAQHFSHALGADSGFTLAAFALVRTEGWGANVVDIERVQEIAWDGRSRLSPRDRVLLEAYLGPQGQWYNWADLLRARERAVSALPGEADAWFLLGDAYYHGGSMLGFPDADERATQAFERAAALDSMYVDPLQHLAELATRGSDTTEIRRRWQWFVQRALTTREDEHLRFVTAVALSDEEMLADALDRLAVLDWFAPSRAAWLAQASRGAQYLDTLTAIMHSRALTQDERNDAARFGYVIAMNRGRPGEASDLISSLVPHDSDWHLIRALYWNGHLEDTALVLQRADSTGRAPFGLTAAEQRGQLVTACRLARWRLARGETSDAAYLLQRLEAGLAMGDSVVPDGASPVCSSLVRAMLAVRQGRPNAMVLIERVDSILLSWPQRTDFLIGVDVSNLMTAGLFEELGKPERALAAVRRRGYAWSSLSFLSTMLREEGRLAALTGDREGAIRAYTHYLELRSDPEPGVLPEVELVRDELARLLGEPD